jgi:hypothetical protein
MKRMIAAAAATAALLTACNLQVPDTTLVISSDPKLGAQVAELLPELAARARMELVRPIRAERKTREQLEAYILFKLDEEMSEEEAGNLTRAYSLVGLVEADLDLRGLMMTVYQEQVAGFYDPDSTAFFLMEDMPEEDIQGVMIHELVHAVQDQTANLDSLTAEERGNDRRAAAQSAIEGHATLIMMEYMLEQLRGEPVALTDLPDISQLLGQAMEAMRDQYPALASAPAIVQEALLFPYLEGYSYVSALWESRDGRPAPFGPHLPQSTEQVLRPYLALGPEVDPPTDLEIEPVQGYETVYGNTFGQGEFRVLLREHLGPGADTLANGWDGDRYALLRASDETDGLVWVSVWDSVEERDRFLAGFRTAVEGFPAPATLVSSQVLGRPGAILRVSIPESVPIRVREKSGS